MNVKAIDWAKKDADMQVAWQYANKYEAFDNYYDSVYMDKIQREHTLAHYKRRAEAIAQEVIAQAMTSPGQSIVVSNPGTTSNASALQFGPYTGSYSGSTAWTNILLHSAAIAWGSSPPTAAEMSAQIDMLSISDNGQITLPKGREVTIPLLDGNTLRVGRDGKTTVRDKNNVIQLTSGEPAMVHLGNGVILSVDKDGNFQVVDNDAKVVYKRNMTREFNPYINASDLLVKFVDYVRSLGVRKSEVMTLEVGLFINWLIIEAAERDQDPVPKDVTPVKEHKLLKGRVLPRCILPTCRRFIPRIQAQNQFPFCNPVHAEHYFKRLAA